MCGELFEAKEVKLFYCSITRIIKKTPPDFQLSRCNQPFHWSLLGFVVPWMSFFTFQIFPAWVQAEGATSYWNLDCLVCHK